MSVDSYHLQQPGEYDSAPGGVCAGQLRAQQDANGIRCQAGKAAENLILEGNRNVELVGSLLYLSTTKRSDISVGIMSRFMTCPEREHMQSVMGVLRYPCKTTDLGLVCGGDEPLRRRLFCGRR